MRRSIKDLRQRFDSIRIFNRLFAGPSNIEYWGFQFGLADDYRSTIDIVLADLGVPCMHANLAAQRWHKHRWWGLFICACPCTNGIEGLSDYDSRTQVIAQRMRERIADDKSLAASLHERVIDHHDYDYFWQLVGPLPEYDATEESPGSADGAPAKESRD